MKIEFQSIQTSPYGIATLIVNTTDKWVDYRITTSMNSVEISIYYDDILKDRLKVETDFLDLETEYRYIQSERQEKDQIVINWFPLRLFRGDEYVNKLKERTKHLK